MRGRTIVSTALLACSLPLARASHHHRRQVRPRAAGGRPPPSRVNSGGRVSGLRSEAGVAAPRPLRALARTPPSALPTTHGRRAAPSDAGIMAYFWHPPPDVVFASEPKRRRDEGSVGQSRGSNPGTSSCKAHPRGATSPVVTFERSACVVASRQLSVWDETFPRAGCWHLDLTIGSAQAAIDLLVAPAPSPTP